MSRYSLIYSISDVKELEDYIIYELEQIKPWVSQIIVISSVFFKYQLEEKYSVIVDEWIDSEKCSVVEIASKLSREAEKILFSNNLFYGPFDSWEKILHTMENSDCWALVENSENFFQSALSCISKKYLDSLRYLSDKGFFFEINMENDVVCSCCNEYVGNYDARKFRSMDLIRYGIPVLYKRAFEDNDFDITMNYQIQQALDYIQINTEYDIGLIYKSILRSFNMTALYKNLHWNYVLHGNDERKINPDLKIAIVISLYYEKPLSRNLEYVKNIPGYVDVYLVLKKASLIPLVEKYIKYNQLKWNVILAKENRGRDLSALLVEAKSILDSYMYFGFLHDKQTTGGIGADLIGDDFNDSLFENLVGGKGYVSEIINLFEENKNLGIVAAPELCHGTYFSFLGRAWSNNYENVRDLAEKLELDVKIEKEHPPYILATAFWCRTDALKKLFEYGWKYEDFPEEPLDLDGTLNHALERILMYVSQDAGYYAGIVSNERFAGMYMSNLRTLLETTLRVCYKNTLFTKYSELHGNRGMELLEFCKKTEDIYIYGAGGNASRIADFLYLNSITLKGFIVSDGYRKTPMLDGIRVFELSELVESIEDLEVLHVVVSVNEKIRDAVMDNIKSKEIKNYFLV